MALEPLPGPLSDTKMFYRYMELFSESYEKFVNNEPVICSVSKKEIWPMMHPGALIIDVSCIIVAFDSVH